MIGEGNKTSTEKQWIGRLFKCDCRVTIQIRLNYKININNILFSPLSARCALVYFFSLSLSFVIEFFHMSLIQNFVFRHFCFNLLFFQKLLWPRNHAPHFKWKHFRNFFSLFIFIWNFFSLSWLVVILTVCSFFFDVCATEFLCMLLRLISFSLETLVLDIHCSGFAGKLDWICFSFGYFFSFGCCRTVFEVHVENRTFFSLYLIRIDTFFVYLIENTSLGWENISKRNSLGVFFSKFKFGLKFNNVESICVLGDDSLFCFVRKSEERLLNVFNVDLVLVFFSRRGLLLSFKSI